MQRLCVAPPEPNSHWCLLLCLTEMWSADLKSVTKSREEEFSLAITKLCVTLWKTAACAAWISPACIFASEKLVYSFVQTQTVWNEASRHCFWPCNLDASDSLAERVSSCCWLSSSLLLPCTQARLTEKQRRSHVWRHPVDFRFRFSVETFSNTKMKAQCKQFVRIQNTKFWWGLIVFYIRRLSTVWISPP